MNEEITNRIIMKRHQPLLICLSLFCYHLSITWGQVLTDSVCFVVEFRKDDHHMSVGQQKELKAFMNEVQNPVAVSLRGHTDWDGSEAYNMRLSERRTFTVSHFLTDTLIVKLPVACHFSGEVEPIADNESVEGQQRNRRVEVWVHFTLPLLEALSIEEEMDHCGDTLITLPDGTLIELDKCDYVKYQNCISIQEFITPQAIRDSELHTMSPDDEPMVSGGMLRYSICDDLELRTYIPVSEDCMSGSMNLYEQDEDGVWQQLENVEVEPVELNGRLYYPVSLSGIGTLNLDKVMPPAPTPWMKFIGKRGIKLEVVMLQCSCPLTVMSYTPVNRRKRKIKIPMTCCDSAQVWVSATTRDGKRLELGYELLADLQRVKNFGYCPTDVRWKFLFIQKRNKRYKRRYRLKIDDFN